jgi:molecular chaperone GrpE
MTDTRGPNGAGRETIDRPAETATPQADVGAAAPQTGEAVAEAATATASDAEAAPDPVAALTAEVNDLKDKYLRALAEVDNMRRRTERAVADARLYGISAFARDVLTVADNMERALQALDAELREKADSAVKGLLDGVELTERELHKVLEKHGVRKLDPQGQRFDPNFHQAMFETPDPTVPAGTVVQVIQAGYTIGDRVLRPALVAVSKGGPKAVPAGAANDDATSAEPASAEVSQPSSEA